MAFKTESGDRWERNAGYVYFIGAGAPPAAVKVGISTKRDFRRRLSTLQCGNHEPLTVLGVIPFEEGERPMLAAAACEREVHVLFAQLQRFRPAYAGAEWFTTSPELLAFITDRTVPPSGHDVPASIATPGLGRAGHQ